MSRNIRLIVIAAAIIVLLAAAVVADAYTLNDILISESAGTGANAAVCVIDFGSASYAFSYSFDGSKTGWDMLQALDAGTGLDLTYDDSWGSPFVTGFSYDGHSLQGDGSASSNYYWWAYSLSTDGESWSDSMTGADGRTLSNGDWDAWIWANTWPAPAPDVPVVPEPGTLISLLSLGGALGAAALRRR